MNELIGIVAKTKKAVRQRSLFLERGTRVPTTRKGRRSEALTR